MVEIPNSLRSLFSGTVEERDGSYVVTVPSSEIEQDALSHGETYRVAILETQEDPTPPARDPPPDEQSRATGQQGPPEPPVDEGEIRDVTIETVGDQGDGIAKVERGYVVIVPDTQPGSQPTVEIETVRENVAFATVVESDPRSL